MKKLKRLLSVLMITALVTANNTNLPLAFGEDLQVFESQEKENTQEDESGQNNGDDEGEIEIILPPPLEDMSDNKTLEPEEDLTEIEEEREDLEEEELNKITNESYITREPYIISEYGEYDLTEFENHESIIIYIEDNLEVKITGKEDVIFNEVCIEAGENVLLTIENLHVENQVFSGAITLNDNAVLIAEGENSLTSNQTGTGTIHIVEGAVGTVTSNSSGELSVTGNPAVYGATSTGLESVLNIEGNLVLSAYGLGEYPAVGGGIHNSTINIMDDARVYAENSGSGTGIGTRSNAGLVNTTINIGDNAFVEAHGGDFGSAGIGTGMSRSYNLDSEVYINITGNADVLAYGGNSYRGQTGGGAGIGGGAYSGINEIYINTTGTVEAHGGMSEDGYSGGAGIGSSVAGSFMSNEGYIGKIYIQDGTICAYGNDGGAGIGTGFKMILPEIIIDGGTIVAQGGKYGAGIGGGYASSWESTGIITIKDAEVEASGGIWASGIGSGSNSRYTFDIEIENAEVFALGGHGGAAIGGGYTAAGGNIRFGSGAVVTAYAGAAEGVPAIGGGQSGGKANLYVAEDAVLGAFSKGTFTDTISQKPAIHADFVTDENSAFLVMATLGGDDLLNEGEEISVDGRIYALYSENKAMAFTVSDEGVYDIVNSEGKGISISSAKDPVNMEGCIWGEENSPGNEFDDSWKEKYNQSTYSVNGDTITVHGTYYPEESLYYYVVPEITQEHHRIIIDLDAYFDMVSEVLYNNMGGWSPGANRSIKIKIINASQCDISYENANFELLDDLDYLGYDDDEILKYQIGYVPDTRPYERDIILSGNLEGIDRDKIPYSKTHLRVQSTPLQYLFSSQAGREFEPNFQLGSIRPNVDILLKMQVDEEIENRLEEVYGQRFDSYSQYILHFYNNVTGTGNGAESLEELPIGCKVNLFGYAGGEPHYTTGNPTVTFPSIINPEEREKYIAYMEEHTDFYDEYGYVLQAGNAIQMFVIESDPEIQAMAWNLIYSRGILFSFLNDDREFKVNFGNTRADQSDFGWNSYINTDFSVDTISGQENITPVQKSIFRAFGAMNLVLNQDMTLESPIFGLQGYVAVNGIVGSAYFRGISGQLELKAVYHGGTEEQIYNVHYHSNYGSMSETERIFSYKENTEVIVQKGAALFQAPDGKTFDRWEEREEDRYYSAGSKFLMPDRDVHLYAIWKEKPVIEPPGPDKPDPDKPDPDRPDPTDPPETKWPDEEVVPVFGYQHPEPQLNKEDHFAYIAGYPDKTVQPQGHLTREEAASIFFRLLSDDTRDYYYSAENPFYDVDEGRWSNKAISTLYNAGILTGYEDNNFVPAGKVTRAELSMIISNFETRTGEIITDYFIDIEGHWAEYAINRIHSIGWITGYPDKTFRPDTYITRAETVVLINKALERHVYSEEDLLPDMIQWPDNKDKDSWYYYDIQEATNTHEYYKRKDGSEKWISLIPNPDWYLLER